MSKKLNSNIAILSIGAVLAGSIGLAAITNSGNAANAAKSSAESTLIAATGAKTELGGSLVDETVYVFADANGSVKKTISSDWTKNSLGLDEYKKTEGKEDTPIRLKVTYKLDGQEISAKDLKGKSGKVEISYNYENTNRDKGLFVPYAVMAGLILNNENFKDVEVENAKLVNDGDKTIIASVLFPGLKENLGLSNYNIPDKFKITANATNFELGMTMSVATSEIFSQLDTSSLDSLSGLSGQLGKLENGMDQLISGSSALYNGLSELNDKSGALVDGIKQLSSGATELKNGSSTLAQGLETAAAGTKKAGDGLTQLAAGNATVINGINQAANGIETAVTNIQQVEALLDPTDPKEAQIKGALDSVIAQALTPIANGLKANVTYTEGANNLAFYLANVQTLADQQKGVPYLATKLTEAAEGAKALTAGAEKLEGGLAALDSKTPALLSGIAKLKQGSGDLASGLNTFNAQGVSRLISAAGSLDNLSTKLKSTVNLAKNQKPVKYIYRTDEVK